LHVNRDPARHVRSCQRSREPSDAAANALAREDFATILDELDFMKPQLSRPPTRRWFNRMALISFGSVWALPALVPLLLVR
jgi:hypothetical protein